MLNYLELPELQLVLAAAEKKSIKLKAMLAMMAFTGTRLSETISLPLSSFIQDDQIPPVVHLPPYICKGKRPRLIIIPAPLAAILKQYLLVRLRKKFVSPLLFPGPQGGKYSLSAIEKQTLWLCQSVLHRRVTPHSFRHTFGTLLSRTSSIRVVQEALGHASLSSTQIYTHVTQRDLQLAVDQTFNSLPPDRVEEPSPLEKAVTGIFSSLS